MNKINIRIKDLRDFIFHKVVIYTEKDDMEFHDLYKGTLEGAPDELLELSVRSIAARRKNIMDICVKDEIK